MRGRLIGFAVAAVTTSWLVYTPGWAAGATPASRWSAESNQDGANFGNSVGTAGDVNGDGYDDVIVGAPNYDHGQSDEGRADVYMGSPSGLSLTPNWRAEGNQDGALFGYSVGTAGDVNGDGYDDVIVGAPYYDHHEGDEGAALAYLGSATGLSATPSWRVEGNQVGAGFGYSVGTAGDVNGDGYDDVIVGAPYYDQGYPDQGYAYAYLGSASGLSTSAIWVASVFQQFAYFGNSVGTAGDVNADGYDDVIVGAEYYNSEQEGSVGRASAYLGSASGLSFTASWVTESDQAGVDFGVSVGTAGDVNADGYDDVIVGASLYDNGQSDEGRAFAYLGSASGLSTTPSWVVEGNQADALFGYSVWTAGDLNGDGYDDVIVGAKTYTNGQAQEGRAFIYKGSPSGLSATPSRTAEGNQADAEFGSSVGTAGDVNGDGRADLIVGAPLYNHGELDEGRAIASGSA